MYLSTMLRVLLPLQCDQWRCAMAMHAKLQANGRSTSQWTGSEMIWEESSSTHRTGTRDLTAATLHRDVLSFVLKLLMSSLIQISVAEMLNTSPSLKNKLCTSHRRHVIPKSSLYPHYFSLPRELPSKYQIRFNTFSSRICSLKFNDTGSDSEDFRRMYIFLHLGSLISQCLTSIWLMAKSDLLPLLTSK